MGDARRLAEGEEPGRDADVARRELRTAIRERVGGQTVADLLTGAPPCPIELKEIRYLQRRSASGPHADQHTTLQGYVPLMSD